MQDIHSISILRMSMNLYVQVHNNNNYYYLQVHEIIINYTLFLNSNRTEKELLNLVLQKWSEKHKPFEAEMSS